MFFAVNDKITAYII